MRFGYQIQTKEGKREHGFIESTDEHAAANALKGRGAFVLEITPFKGSGSLLGFLTNRVSKREMAIFTKQLAVMIKSGLTIVAAIEALQEQTQSKAFRRVLKELGTDLKGGATIEAAFSKHETIFPHFYTNVIKAGEKSGKLEEVLFRLADQLENDYQLTSRIRGAMAYPLLIIVAIIGVVVLMLIFVIPQLQSIFTESGAKLPLITRVLIVSSDLLRRYFFIWLAVGAGLIWGINRFAKTNYGGNLWDRIKLKLPVFGKLFAMIYMARLTRTMGTLVAAGLPMLDVFDTVKDVVGNRLYKAALERVRTSVENGTQLSIAMKNEPIFPPMIVQMVTVGEKSGNLDYVLGTMAEFFERDVDQMTKNLATLLEPLLMIVMGVGVGFVVASVIVPIYNLVNIQGQ